MSGKQKIVKYQEALWRWHLAQERNDPLVTKPTRAEFGLFTEAEKWAAERVEQLAAMRIGRRDGA